MKKKTSGFSVPPKLKRTAADHLNERMRTEQVRTELVYARNAHMQAMAAARRSPFDHKPTSSQPGWNPEAARNGLHGPSGLPHV